jgi:hypothetical protein
MKLNIYFLIWLINKNFPFVLKSDFEIDYNRKMENKLSLLLSEYCDLVIKHNICKSNKIECTKHCISTRNHLIKDKNQKIYLYNKH